MEQSEARHMSRQRWGLAIAGVAIAVLGAIAILWFGQSQRLDPISSRDGAAGSNAQSSLLLERIRQEPTYSGAWIDQDQVFQVRLIEGANTALIELLLADIKHHVVADRLYTHEEQLAALAKVDDARFMVENGIASLGLDEQTGNVEVLAIPERMAEAERAVARRLPSGIFFVAPGHMPQTADGLDNHRDVFPIAGATSIQLSAAPGSKKRKQCTTAFGMHQASTGKYFQLTAAHCTEGWEGAWTGTGWSASLPFQSNPIAYDAVDAAHVKFTYYVGTNVGYRDSLCASSQPAHRLWTCGPGTVEYASVGDYAGDISVLKVRRAQPWIWVSNTKRAPVYYKQTKPLISGDASLCAAGQTTATYCGLWVTEPNVSVLYCDNEECLKKPSWNNIHLLKGLTRVTKADGRCSNHGDSGGAVFRYVTGPNGQKGGVRAVGVISGISDDAHCTVYFTPVAKAERLFASSILLQR